jgi:hypothetical protein
MDLNSLHLLLFMSFAKQSCHKRRSVCLYISSAAIDSVTRGTSYRLRAYTVPAVHVLSVACSSAEFLVNAIVSL